MRFRIFYQRSGSLDREDITDKVFLESLSELSYRVEDVTNYFVVSDIEFDVVSSWKELSELSPYDEIQIEVDDVLIFRGMIDLQRTFKRAGKLHLKVNSFHERLRHLTIRDLFTGKEKLSRFLLRVAAKLNIPEVTVEVPRYRGDFISWKTDFDYEPRSPIVTGFMMPVDGFLEGFEGFIDESNQVIVRRIESGNWIETGIYADDNETGLAFLKDSVVLFKFANSRIYIRLFRVWTDDIGGLIFDASPWRTSQSGNMGVNSHPIKFKAASVWSKLFWASLYRYGAFNRLSIYSYDYESDSFQAEDDFDNVVDFTLDGLYNSDDFTKLVLVRTHAVGVPGKIEVRDSSDFSLVSSRTLYQEYAVPERILTGFSGQLFGYLPLVKRLGDHVVVEIYEISKFPNPPFSFSIQARWSYESQDYAFPIVFTSATRGMMEEYDMFFFGVSGYNPTSGYSLFWATSEEFRGIQKFDVWPTLHIFIGSSVDLWIKLDGDWYLVEKFAEPYIHSKDGEKTVWETLRQVMSDFCLVLVILPRKLEVLARNREFQGWPLDSQKVIARSVKIMKSPYDAVVYTDLKGSDFYKVVIDGAGEYQFIWRPSDSLIGYNMPFVEALAGVWASWFRYKTKLELEVADLLMYPPFRDLYISLPEVEGYFRILGLELNFVEERTKLYLKEIPSPTWRWKPGMPKI